LSPINTIYITIMALQRISDINVISHTKPIK